MPINVQMIYTWSPNNIFNTIIFEAVYKYIRDSKRVLTLYHYIKQFYPDNLIRRKNHRILYTLELQIVFIQTRNNCSTQLSLSLSLSPSLPPPPPTPTPPYCLESVYSFLSTIISIVQPCHNTRCFCLTCTVIVISMLDHTDFSITVYTEY